MANIPAFQAGDASSILAARTTRMADVAQLVRASGCGSEGRGFNSHHSPQNKYEGILPSYLFWDVLLI